MKFILVSLMFSVTALWTRSSSLFAVALSANVKNPNNNKNPTTTTTNQKLKNAPLAISEELGCSPTLTALKKPFRGNDSMEEDCQKRMVYFDPLQLAKDDNFGRYREAELKHGRVAMVAVVISLVELPDPIGFLQSGQTPRLWALLQEEVARENAWIILPLVVLVCGILDVLLLVQASPQDMPGDYGLGYWGVRDKGQNERSLVSELENGRLAMMTILYWLLMELVAPSVPWTMVQEFFSSAFLANDPVAVVGKVMTTTTSSGLDDVITTTATAAATADATYSIMDNVEIMTTSNTIEDVVTTTTTAATTAEATSMVDSLL